MIPEIILRSHNTTKGLKASLTNGHVYVKTDYISRVSKSLLVY